MCLFYLFHIHKDGFYKEVAVFVFFRLVWHGVAGGEMNKKYQKEKHHVHDVKAKKSIWILCVKTSGHSNTFFLLAARSSCQTRWEEQCYATGRAINWFAQNVQADSREIPVHIGLKGFHFGVCFLPIVPFCVRPGHDLGHFETGECQPSICAWNRKKTQCGMTNPS